MKYANQQDTKLKQNCHNKAKKQPRSFTERCWAIRQQMQASFWISSIAEPQAPSEAMSVSSAPVQFHGSMFLWTSKMCVRTGNITQCKVRRNMMKLTSCMRLLVSAIPSKVMRPCFDFLHSARAFKETEICLKFLMNFIGSCERAPAFLVPPTRPTRVFPVPSSEPTPL